MLEGYTKIVMWEELPLEIVLMCINAKREHCIPIT
jgi:hypothetical protein